MSYRDDEDWDDEAEREMAQARANDKHRSGYGRPMQAPSLGDTPTLCMKCGRGEAVRCDPDRQRVVCVVCWDAIDQARADDKGHEYYRVRDIVRDVKARGSMSDEDRRELLGIEGGKVLVAALEERIRKGRETKQAGGRGARKDDL